MDGSQFQMSLMLQRLQSAEVAINLETVGSKMDGSQFQMSLMLQRLQSAEVAINLETVGSR